MPRTSTRMDSRSKSKQRGKGSIRRKISFVLLALIVTVVFLPRIVTSNLVFQPLLANLLDDDQMSVTVGTVQAGWFRPISAQGIQIQDQHDKTVLELSEVTTTKGIVGWILNQSDLGTIQVRGLRADVEAKDGSTNLERLLSTLQTPAPTEIEDTPSDQGAFQPQGRIQLVDCQLALRAAGNPQRWLVDIPSAQLQLPTAETALAPLSVQAHLSAAGGMSEATHGSMAVEIKHVQDSQMPHHEIRAKLADIPLGFWQVLKARLPDLPVDAVDGDVSMIVAASIVDAESWSIVLKDLVGESLVLDAPELVGATPATLKAISGGLECSLTQGQLKLTHAQVDCDFASASASGQIPWPISAELAQHPLRSGGNLRASGRLDLAKLVEAAATLIPVRENTRIVTGSAAFELQHESQLNGTASAVARLQLAGLKAVADGKDISWQDPLDARLTVTQLPDGSHEFGALATSEFVNVEGGGNLEQGRVGGSVDLSVLRERLDQFVELPIQAMNGQATVQCDWQQQAAGMITANAALKTSPVTLATLTGKELVEPAWDGTASLQCTLSEGQLTHVNTAQLRLHSDSERLIFDLQQPLALQAGTTSAPSELAAFSLDVHADLANCNRRGTVWLSEPTGVDVQGRIQLVANGFLDSSHVEIVNANWNGEPVVIEAGGSRFAEPRIVGKFKGRFDSSDLTRTVVDSLELQSASVSLIAQDGQADDGVSRLGRARFLVDLESLLRNANSANTQAIAGAIMTTGRCNGDLAWQINSQAAGLNLRLVAENLAVSQARVNAAALPLWNEPQLSATLKGTWDASTGNFDIPESSVDTGWLNFTGNCKLHGVNDVMQLALDGQAAYDCQVLSQKLAPYTGGEVILAGRKTVPVNVSWKSLADASVFAGLDLDTRLDWDQGWVAGVNLGNASVPVAIKKGVLASAAEIPVSAGKLRWDFTTDLSQEQLIVSQKPMTMLENVAITEQMCKGWLKYVAPLMAETTSVDGRLSLRVDEATLQPLRPNGQTVVGQLVIHNATVGPSPLSDSVISLVKQLDAVRRQDFAMAVSSTQRVWMDMPEQKINFQMRDGRVFHENLNVKVGDVVLSTGGSVGIDGSMDMLAAIPVPDSWVDKNNEWMESLRGQTLQVPMVGTVTNPRVETRYVEQLVQQSMKQAAGGYLEQELNKGFDKLLGTSGKNVLGELLNGAPAPGPNAPPPANQNQPSNKTGIRGLGEQLLNGGGLGIPGLFGGSGTN